MQTGPACTTVVTRAPGRTGHAAALGLALAAALLAGCSAVTEHETGTVPAQQAAAAPPPRIVRPLHEAVASLTDALLAKAELASSGQRALVIDPPIDRARGISTAATRITEAGIDQRVRERHPMFEMRPFTIASLADQPLIVLGSIASAAEAGSLEPAAGQPSVYRIWAVLADLRTNRVLGRETAWVHAADVDPTPTAFFRDRPAWSADPVIAAYLRTCGSTAGAPIDPVYRQVLPTQALAAEAIAHYEARRRQGALN